MSTKGVNSGHGGKLFYRNAENPRETRFCLEKQACTILSMTGHELLNVKQMSAADQMAIEAGTSGLLLMENAGRAVAEHAAALAGTKPIVVLCGPGNNGGDGYVAARYLQNWGNRVRVAALGDPKNLKGDAGTNFKRWEGPVEPLAPVVLEEGCIIIDALFGAGLTRDIEGVAADVLNAARELKLRSIAVDLPSGINGDTGEIMGTALPAQRTVTFFRKKPGHLLYPGRGYCGDVKVADIGIPLTVLKTIQPEVSENSRPTIKMSPTAHKYDRGHVLIAGGAEMTGAARLCAMAARRAGAGLVTLAVPPETMDLYRSNDPGNLVEERSDLASNLLDERRNVVVIGPGLGVGAETRSMVLGALGAQGKTVILDADALTTFADTPDMLFSSINGTVIMTPHEGEFRRLFDCDGDKLARAREAATQSGAIIVLKGADTVIATPDGRALINANAPPWLATAGSGDVLAGMIAGFAACGDDAFDATAAAVWCHGDAGARFGPGLIAEDIVTKIPEALSDCLEIDI